MPIRSIGLDIGHHAVRAVALERTGASWRIAASANVPRRDQAGEIRPLGAVVGEIDSLIGLARGSVTVADSAHTILVRFVATIPMPPDRMAKLLRLELSQHTEQGGELAGDTFPVPLDGDEIIHACALAQPVEQHAFLTDLSRAGVTPKRIHVGAAAQYNATLASPATSGEDLVLLVDIGAQTTRVTLLGDGRLLAFRQLATGGQAFTDALVQGRGITDKQAEQLKLHWAAARAGDVGTGNTVATAVADADQPGFVGDPPAKQTGFDDMLEEGLQEPGAQTMAIGGTSLGPEMTRVAEALHVQIFNTMSWFRAQLQRDKLPVAKMLLCGGGAALSGLGVYLSRRMGVPVERYDPCAGLEGDKPEIPHEFTGAIGLALSEDPAAVRLDLLPEKLVLRRLWNAQLIWPYVAAAALVLAAVLFGVARWRERSELQASIDAIAQHQQERDRLEKTLESLEAERKAQSADLATIASRIHFNRDLLYVIRVLKERVPDNQELWITRLQTIEPETKSATARPTLSARGKPAPAETMIERGSIEIEGRVKFKKDKTTDELNDFFNRYRKQVESATAGSTGEPLFDPTRTFVTAFSDVEEKAVGATAPATQPSGAKRPGRVVDGSIPFEFRLVFRPTDLSQIDQNIMAVEKTGPEAP